MAESPRQPYGRALRARLVARLRDRMEKVGYCMAHKIEKLAHHGYMQ